MINNSKKTPEDRGHLLTEQSNPKSISLDTLDSYSLVSLFSDEDKQPQIAVERSIKSITRAIDLIVDRLSKGGRLFYIGSGTPR